MFDFSQFDAYRRENTNTNHHNHYCDVDWLLRFWREAKAEYLTKLFGDKLILERSFEYARDTGDIQRDMEEMVSEQHMFLRHFSDKFCKAVNFYDETMYNDDNKYRAVRSILGFANHLVDNIIQLPFGMSHYTFYIEGKSFTVQNGQKITRAIGHICKMIGLEDEWEKFRIAHSLVLNQKKIKGTMCLSIHPLDYATASDNDNGWSSCMSWREEGCYRMGTVEMMNSPMVICAYVKSDKAEMCIDNRPWNSKKWRTWAIVTKDAICTNRQYPYHSDSLAIEVIKWIKELCNDKLGWTYEEEISTNFFGHMDECDLDIHYRTNYMYNDMGDIDILGVFKSNWSKYNMPDEICFSGKAECMVCGDEIAIGIQDSSALECTDCWSEFTCDRCGIELSEENVYRDPDDNILCYDCWDDQCYTCYECGETLWKDSAIDIQFPVYLGAAKGWARKQKDLHPDIKGLINGSSRWRWATTDLENFYAGHLICESCAEEHGWINNLYESDNNKHLENIEHQDLIVLNPNKVNRDEYLKFVGVPGFRSSLNILEHPRSYTTDSDIQQATQYRDFWYDQYEHFTKDFNKAFNA